MKISRDYKQTTDAKGLHRSACFKFVPIKRPLISLKRGRRRPLGDNEVVPRTTKCTRSKCVWYTKRHVAGKFAVYSNESAMLCNFSTNRTTPPYLYVYIRVYIRVNVYIFAAVLSP